MPMEMRVARGFALGGSLNPDRHLSSTGALESKRQDEAVALLERRLQSFKHEVITVTGGHHQRPAGGDVDGGHRAHAHDAILGIHTVYCGMLGPVATDRDQSIRVPSPVFQAKVGRRAV